MFLIALLVFGEVLVLILPRNQRKKQQCNFYYEILFMMATEFEVCGFTKNPEIEETLFFSSNK